MNGSLSEASASSTPRHALRVAATVVAALAVTVLAACGNGGGGGGGKVETPTFGELEIPDPSSSSHWSTFTTSSPPAEVLPTQGRAVRLWFYAPGGSVFDVSLRDLAGTTVATLSQNSGGNPPPEAGYFEILSEDANSSPAKYHMYVRAPLSLMDQGNYDILVVHKSGRTDMSDSDPMVVPLRQRKIFTVTVMVQGDGHVTSNPPGIQCGTAYSGAPLTQCSYTFGPGAVALAPNSNDSTVTRFKGWDGNCPSGVQVCTLTLDGTTALGATATFEARNASTPVLTCSAAPTVPGWRWIGLPGCSDISTHPGITLHCDSAGYFCCAAGSSSDPRCHGEQLIAADCRNQPNQGLNARLIQPGGCYEVDSFP